MADEDRPSAPVTVKAMPTDTWELARRHAAQQGQTMAEWLSRAIRQLADREAEVPAGTLPETVAEPPQMSPEALEALLRATAACSAAAALPVPKVVARHAFALLQAHLRAARGLPPLRPRANRSRIRANLLVDETVKP